MEHIAKKLFNWASILEPQAPAAGGEHRLDAVHLPPPGPDAGCALGKGATVGCVIPTLGAIMPAAVGVDIGCGMVAVRTRSSPRTCAGVALARLREAIEKAIPLSAGVYNGAIYDDETASA